VLKEQAFVCKWNAAMAAAMEQVNPDWITP